MATAAQAQPAASDESVASTDDPSSQSEIIVTANKRAERIVDVALGITAVTGTELNDKRLVDIQDLATRVPGLSFQRGGGFGIGQRLVIRGLNTGGTNATVASVLDDVPLTISAPSGSGADFAADFDPYDLQRVEVLKGPQGTLYGASALGGLVKYVTNAPRLDRFEGGFETGLADLKHGDTGAFAKGYINAPLIDGVLALRASGYYEYTPGWISNNFVKREEVNTLRRYGARASLLFRPSDVFSARASVFLQNRKAEGYDLVEIKGYTSAADPFGLLAGYNRKTFLPEPNSSKSQIYSLTLNYDFGGAVVQSITSYGHIDTRYDFESGIYVALSPFVFGRANTDLVSRSVSQLKKFNQELRISSDNDAAAEGHGLEWQAGLFYTHETTDSGNNYFTRDATTGAYVVTPASVTATPPGSTSVFIGTFDSRYEEIAGYADATYHFSPAFDVEVGGRLFRNTQSYTTTTGGAIFTPPAFTTAGPYSSNETRATFAVAPRLHITPDVMVYARAASGYRPGGPNPVIPPPALPGDTPGTTPSSFTADTTINYEAGLKGSLLGGKLVFDVAGFYIDWSDIQVATTITRGGGTQGYPATINAGKAVSKGAEWNITVSPLRGLTFGWLGAYTDASLKQNIPAINAIAGQQLPFVPKWSTTLTADLDVPLSGEIRGVLGGSYSYVC
jgi:outer membrane receptor protein involved in Fe transport